ncbi:hypothetical protein B566_EDAN002502 [Ephemera danica]|nr:hypothetical protein B566_EDAN002502 [Ephemera danica]
MSAIMMMDPLDITAIPPELWFQQFVALDGLNSGVPTRTTPTLTPTTLRNIEQTFLDNLEVTGGGGSMYLNTESKGGWGGGNTNIGRLQASPSPALTPSPTPQQAPTRRNMGGRRPIKDDKISPEEEERRKVRRERNKLAAARCRKRRLDHTNELLMVSIQETEGLEQKKQCMQSEIQQLQREKEELEFILEAHKPCCRLLGPPSSPPDVKPHRQQLQSRPLPKLLPVQNKPPQRPSSLPVAAFTPAGGKLGGGGALSEVAGVPITTPSAGIPFNFDSLMEGGTGLTPVSGVAPTCSSQQRSSGGNVASAAAAGDLATSPDASNHAPPKLVSL